MYEYRAKVTNVVDGDTIDVLIDQGFDTFRRERLRLYGIDTPEKRGPERIEGLKVKKYVEEKILGHSVIIETRKDPNFRDRKGSFGRYLATVYYSVSDERFINLNKELERVGMAKPFMVD